MRETFFEGTPAKIPFAYKEILEAEYKEKALTLTEFEGYVISSVALVQHILTAHRHRFDEDKLEWIPIPKAVKPALQNHGQAQKKSGENIDPVKLQQPAPADGPPKASEQNVSKQPNTQKPPTEADTTPDAKQPVKSDELAKLPQAHPQPHPQAHPGPIQRAAADKVYSKEEKKAAVVNKAEEKRRVAEQKAIEKEEKRKEREEKRKKAAKARKLIGGPNP